MKNLFLLIMIICVCSYEYCVNDQDCVHTYGNITINFYCDVGTHQCYSRPCGKKYGRFSEPCRHGQVCDLVIRKCVPIGSFPVSGRCHPKSLPRINSHHHQHHHRHCDGGDECIWCYGCTGCHGKKCLPCLRGTGNKKIPCIPCNPHNGYPHRRGSKCEICDPSPTCIPLLMNCCPVKCYRRRLRIP